MSKLAGTPFNVTIIDIHNTNFHINELQRKKVEHSTDYTQFLHKLREISTNILDLQNIFKDKIIEINFHYDITSSITVTETINTDHKINEINAKIKDMDNKYVNAYEVLRRCEEAIIELDKKLSDLIKSYEKYSALLSFVKYFEETEQCTLITLQLFIDERKYELSDYAQSLIDYCKYTWMTINKNKIIASIPIDQQENKTYSYNWVQFTNNYKLLPDTCINMTTYESIWSLLVTYKKHGVSRFTYIKYCINNKLFELLTTTKYTNTIKKNSKINLDKILIENNNELFNTELVAICNNHKQKKLLNKIINVQDLNKYFSRDNTCVPQCGGWDRQNHNCMCGSYGESSLFWNVDNSIYDIRKFNIIAKKAYGSGKLYHQHRQL